MLIYGIEQNIWRLKSNRITLIQLQKEEQQTEKETTYSKVPSSDNVFC